MNKKIVCAQFHESLPILHVLMFQTEVKKAQPREVMQSLQGGRGRVGRGMAARGFCKLFGDEFIRP